MFESWDKLLLGLRLGLIFGFLLQKGPGREVPRHRRPVPAEGLDDGESDAHRRGGGRRWSLGSRRDGQG